MSELSAALKDFFSESSEVRELQAQLDSAKVGVATAQATIIAMLSGRKPVFISENGMTSSRTFFLNCYIDYSMKTLRVVVHENCGEEMTCAIDVIEIEEASSIRSGDTDRETAPPAAPVTPPATTTDEPAF